MIDKDFDFPMPYHKWDDNFEQLDVIVPEEEWKWQKYPEENLVSERSGFKVAWKTYSDFKSANQCAYAAGINAYLKMQQGFDFGYLYPATITEVSEGNWEVVIP